VSIHDAVRQRGHTTLDLEQARARIRAGRAAFDTNTLLRDAGDLTRAFNRTAAAFERSGLTANAQLEGLRQTSVDPTALMLSWANGESLPRDPSKRLARTVAGVVGNAILARASADVTEGISLTAWKRVLCPCCGASPDLALATDKRRTLVCWRCDTMWRTEQRGCLGCGADTSPTLARVPSPYLGYELAICNSCGRYLKERRGAPAHALIVERPLTAGLDEAAQQRGLRA
jgi:formate dehydrogenase maturation protein FdhE